jgi:hypothetical protein
MMWVASKSSPIFRAQFQTSLGLRRPVGLTQYIVSGRVRDIATFDDAYSIEAAGQLIRLEPDLSHFIVEYDTRNRSKSMGIGDLEACVVGLRGRVQADACW